MNSIIFHNVNKSFGELIVLERIDFEIEEHKILCLVGPSGCGKSTILNMLSKRFKPDTGSINNLQEKIISYVFQKPRLLPWLTLEENMGFVLADDDKKQEKIKYWLSQVELQSSERLYPAQLSGGMEQRASLARAFSVSADLLLMDEPFKGLDEPLKLRMLDLVYRLWKKTSKTIVFVTHDIREALFLGDKIIALTEKPTRVLEEIPINMKHEERHIGCRKVAKLEEYIYSLIAQEPESKYNLTCEIK